MSLVLVYLLRNLWVFILIKVAHPNSCKLSRLRGSARSLPTLHGDRGRTVVDFMGWVILIIGFCVGALPLETSHAREKAQNLGLAPRSYNLLTCEVIKALVWDPLSF